MDPLSAALRELRGPRWQVWRSGPFVATTEFLVDKQLAAVGRLGRGGRRRHPRRRAAPERRPRDRDAAGHGRCDPRQQQANRDAFRGSSRPPRPSRTLIGLDPDRTVVASNGSDTPTVRPAPWPDVPAIAFVSGRRAEPRDRGADRSGPTGPASGSPRPGSTSGSPRPATRATPISRRSGASVAGESWIEIGQAPYAELGARSVAATVLCDPHAGPRLLGLGRPGEALRLPRRGPPGDDDAAARDRARS